VKIYKTVTQPRGHHQRVKVVVMVGAIVQWFQPAAQVVFALRYKHRLLQAALSKAVNKGCLNSTRVSWDLLTTLQQPVTSADVCDDVHLSKTGVPFSLIALGTPLSLYHTWLIIWPARLAFFFLSSSVLLSCSALLWAQL